MARRNEAGKGLMLIFVCTAIALGGCTSIPAGKYEALRDSGQALLTNTGETYGRIERLQRQFSVATAPDAEIDLDTFKPQFEDKSFDLSPDLRFRESAFEVLVKYLNVLSTLSVKSRFLSVDRASQELAGSLKGLVESSRVMGKDDASTALEISASFGDVTDHRMGKRKRLSALKKMMDAEQGTVEKLSQLIVKNNKKISGRAQVMLKTIIAHANSVRPPYGSLERYHFDAKIADLIAESAEIEASLDAVSKAVSQIPGAHKEIRADLDKEATSFEALHTLLQEAQRANKAYRGLD